MGPPAAKPLHKSLAFRILTGLMGLFMMMSLVLYTRLQDLSDDDLVLGSGGGDGLRDMAQQQQQQMHGGHHHHHHHGEHGHGPQATTKQRSNTDNNADGDNDGDEAKGDILKFKEDQAENKRQREQQGIATPREDFEQETFDPEDWERIRTNVERLRQPEPATSKSGSTDLPYDIHDCPFDPPPNYPFSWNVMDVLDNWNPDDTSLPTSIHQGICVFDGNNKGDQTKSENYRQNEVPFVVQNLPEIWRTAERWMTPGYLEKLIGEEHVFNEHSLDNHFMYWKTKRPRADYVPPTDTVDLTYKEWLEKAQSVQEVRRQTKQEHWYFRLNAMLHNHAYLYEELPFFDPTRGTSLTMVKPKEHRGINCRFGMKGIIAEAHYDSHNNFIALMGGQRRYILAHPNQCENMELYPVGHPSARHSRINWSNAYYNWRDSERPFAQAKVNEIVLQAGDIMYLPTFWFHFIVSLNINYQCNSRSGDSHEYEEYISRCGFGSRREYNKK